MTEAQRHQRRHPPRAGMGRPKGSKNKVSGQLREMVLRALDGAGGVDYLIRQAETSPSAFLALVGKVLPLQLTGQDGKDLIPSTITFVFKQAPGTENRT
jgi:hypothetical protein